MLPSEEHSLKDQKLLQCKLDWEKTLRKDKSSVRYDLNYQLPYA